MAFWFAKSSLPDARVVILGIPLDDTETFMPGTRFGPDKIRACAEAIESYSPYFKQDLTRISIHDAGNLELEGLAGTDSKLMVIKRNVSGYIPKSKPLLLGGEHTLTLPAIQAVLETYPDLAVLHLDAHMDMRDIGEIGGKFAHDTVMRRILVILKPNSLVQVGIRSFSKEELEVQGIRFYEIGEVKRIKSALEKRPLWLTFDLDLLDPSLMPSVGSPEPNGAAYQEVLNLLLGLKGLNFVGADLVEFNPLAADFPAPAILAANLVREICFLLQ